MVSILYLSYDGLTDPLGQSQIIPYLEGLSSKGYKIFIVSFEKREPFIATKNIIANQLNMVDIMWKPFIYHKSPPVLSTLWDLLQLWRTVKDLHHKHSFKVIHCRSYITSIVGLAMKRRYKTEFLFDMRGFWADERVEGGLWNLKNLLFKWIFKYFKKKEKEFLENADAIISLTESAKKEINGWKDFKINVPIEVIPCCVDLELFNYNNVSLNEVAFYQNKLGIISKDFVITYLGAIGTWYMLEEMLDFFKVLLQKNPNAKFLFITTEKSSVIYDVAEMKKISRSAILIYRAKRKEVPSLLLLSNISMFFIRPTYSKKASSPTKQGELMAMGVPIICNGGVGDTDEIINRYNAGKTVHDFTQEEYLSVVKNIEDIVKLEKEPIVSGAHEYFSLNKGIEKYFNIYNQLTAK